MVRASLLDASFERWAAVQMGADVAKEQGTLGAALAAFRSRAITWGEADRAARPAGVRGVDAPVVEWTLPGDLGRDLCAFAEQPDAIGQPLPFDLLARLAEALAPGTSNTGKPYGAVAGELAAAMAEQGETRPVRPSLLGESARRATVAEGRARFIERAMLANDTDLAGDHLERFEAEEAMTFEPSAPRIMLRYAVRVLADVAREDARRERGEYPGPDLDPVLTIPLQSEQRKEGVSEAADPNGSDATGSRTENEPHARSTPANATSPELAAIGFMALSAAAIARIEARTTDPVGAKQIRDYTVARRLFGDICGDLDVTAITKEACQDFLEQLGRVPSQHGKCERYRSMTAREAIRLADKDDAAFMRIAIAPGSDPENAPLVPRMSAATINKHLTSLQTLVGEQLEIDRKGQTPFLAVRFSKSYVKANATFDRRQLEDDRLTAIFHGPVFTGFSDSSADRFLPGETLIRDVHYWVPLVGLFGGERLEELLGLRPDDVMREDGVDLVSIGAIHDRIRARVKNPSSVRKVPVHSVLKELGFLDYARQMRDSGSRMLFPGFRRGGPDKRFGHGFSQWWTEYRRAVGAYKKGQDFRSMRHGVNTRLLAAKVPETIIRMLLGHSQGNSMTGGTYNSGLSNAELASAVNMLRYPELDLKLLSEHARQSQTR